MRGVFAAHLSFVASGRLTHNRPPQATIKKCETNMPHTTNLQVTLTDSFFLLIGQVQYNYAFIWRYHKTFGAFHRQ